MLRGQDGGALQPGKLGHDQIVPRLKAGELPILGHPGHHAGAGDGTGHGVGIFRVAAQDVYVGHPSRGGQIIGDPADPLRGVVRREQERDQKTHGLRTHADGVVAVHMDAQKPQALIACGGDGVHAHDDEIPVKIQRRAVLTHSRHGEGLGADALEF